MVRAMGGVKLVDNRNTENPIDMLRLKEAADKLARANGVRWCGHVLRRPEEDVLMKAMVHEVEGNKRRIGLKKMRQIGVGREKV